MINTTPVCGRLPRRRQVRVREVINCDSGASAAEQAPEAARPEVEQLRGLQADAAAPGGLALVLRRLSRFVGGPAALLGPDDRSVPETPAVDPDLFAAVREDLGRIRSGGARSITLHQRDRVVSAQLVGEQPDAPILLVAAEETALRSAGELITDAARLLWLRWRTDSARGALRRVDDSVTAIREVVLHLLMLGRQDDAQRVADTLRPRLPESVTVCVIESAVSARDAVVARISEATGDRAWIVRCPVYVEHTIVLAPGDRPDGAVRQVRGLAAEQPGVRAGASQVVPLHDVGTGYAQAFHALAVARNGSGTVEVFTAQRDLVSLLGPAARAWAERTLSGLLDFEPRRAQDPDSGALLSTLGSWLNFGTGAARQLKIHRNTLTARMRHVERILGSDLRDIGTQSRLHLALQLLGPPRGLRAADDGTELLELLTTAEVRAWAHRQLAPLLAAEGHLLATLRAWLDGDARLEPAAATLGLSVPAARKRLLRIEGVLERSLLHGPSARYELYFALHINDSPD